MLAVKVNRNYASSVGSLTKNCQRRKIANASTPNNRNVLNFCCSGHHFLVVYVNIVDYIQQVGKKQGLRETKKIGHKFTEKLMAKLKIRRGEFLDDYKK